MAVPSVVALALALTACGSSVPETVVAGTSVTVGWDGTYTSANAAASPTPGNIDIAAAVRAGFGDMVDGEFVADTGFGTVEVTGNDPLTVRYDLAEPSWSDGIPLDAADLLLGWAGATGWFVIDQQGARASTRYADSAVPRIDEFARSIEVTFAPSIRDWQTAVSVPVPAHIVGEVAFDLDDPMAAKQAVIRAIQTGDRTGLDAIATVWNAGFEIADPSHIPADLRLSSGPFLVDSVTTDGDGQRIELVPNSGYNGLSTPQVARIELVPPGDDPVSAVGDNIDVAVTVPTAGNRAPVRALERQDFSATTPHDGNQWVLLLNPTGVFVRQDARAAFLRAVPVRDMIESGGGDWSSAYTPTNAMLAAPGSRAYEVVVEDSGFAETMGEPAADPVTDRESAFVSSSARVCVLFDRGSAFASGAFDALRDLTAEAGWNVTDCGSDDVEGALSARGWNAVIMHVPIPQNPAEIAAQWSSVSETSLTRHPDAARDALVAQLAETSDVYEAREVLAQVEATIVAAAVARPLATNPRLVVVDRRVTGVTARTGRDAPLLYAATGWAVAP